MADAKLNDVPNFQLLKETKPLTQGKVWNRRSSMKSLTKAEQN